MEKYRCGRCQVVLAAVAAPPGELAAKLFDPLVERRLLAAVAEHRARCVAQPGDTAGAAPAVTATAAGSGP